MRGYTTEQTQTQLCEFAKRQLLSFEFDDEVISFNDLQHNYLLLQVDNLHLDHTELLEAYRDLLPARSEWSQLPEKEPYLWDHLIHHLHGAGEIPELAKTVTNPVYLITRTFLRGPTAAKADLRRTTKLLTDPALEWWQQWFADYGPLIAGLESLTHTAATAALRLTNAPDYVELRDLLPAPRNLLRVFLGHQEVVNSQDVVNSVAFSPDGHHLATASDDGTVKIWAQNRVIRTVQLGPEARALCWHGDLLGIAIDSAVVIVRITDTPTC